MDEALDDLTLRLAEIEKAYIVSPDDLRLYHYTSSEGLQGILESRSIWASNSLFLNDSAEVVHLEGFVSSAIEDFVDNDRDLPHVDALKRVVGVVYAHIMNYSKSSLYVLSLTSNPDSLPLWLNYAPRQGYNLLLDMGRLLSLSKGPKYSSDFPWMKAEGPVDLHINMKLGRVIYDDNLKTELVRKLMEVIADEFSQLEYPIDRQDLQIPMNMARVLTTLAELAYLSKHASYSPEEEYRLLIAGQDDPTKKLIRRFRIRNGVFVPFTSVSFSNTDGDCPIAEVTVGPKHNVELAELGLTYLLEHHGLTVPVSVSALPLRD